MSELKLPDWFCLEYETGKIIRNLNSVKELSSYLKSTSVGIRRMAICRAAIVGCKTDQAFISEISDDFFETKDIKEISKMIYKNFNSISSDTKEYQHFIHNLSNVTVYDEYLKPAINPEIDKLMSTDLILPFFASDNPSLIDSKFQFPDFTFPLSTLIKSIAENFLKNIKIFTKELLKKLFAAIKAPRELKIKASISSIIRLLKNLRNNTKAMESKVFKFKIIPELYKRRKKKEKEIVYCKKSFSLRLKIFLSSISTILLYPLRLFWRRKIFVIALFTTIYLFFSFNAFGKGILYRYSGIRLYSFNNDSIESLKSFLRYATDEFTTLTGSTFTASALMNSFNNKQSTSLVEYNEQNAVIKEIFRVTAKSGLNLRETPETSADKVKPESIIFDSQVIYLSDQFIDNDKRMWFLIETDDGYKGWVYSKWLEKVE